MHNIEFLYEKNKAFGKTKALYRNTLTYKSDISDFDFEEIKKIIFFFSSAEKKFKNANILYSVVYTQEVEFADKLTYILLECLLYDLIINKRKRIDLRLRYKVTIKTEGLRNTCLLNYNNISEFKKKFCDDCFGVHYRKIVCYEEYAKDLEYPSRIMGDIKSFLTNCSIDSENAGNISEISIELICNALEHAKADCLVDIDYSSNLYAKSGSNDTYFPVNIAVLSFSENEIWEGIADMCRNEEVVAPQYNKLRQIYSTHKDYFDGKYNEKQFFILSAFQNKITSREGNLSTGGKGLTKLIKGLEDAADTYICYMVTGDTALYFYKDHIRQDQDLWVGFNKQNNINFKPDEHCFAISPLHIKGVGYNLTFILKRSNLNENN